MKFSYESNTFQGEGESIGIPADIVRVAGCSVGCSFCDERSAQPHEYIPGMLQALRCGSQRALMVTGGEPLEFLDDALIKDIHALVGPVEESNLDRQVPYLMLETSGHGDWGVAMRLFQGLEDKTVRCMTISPKLADGYLPRYDLLEHIDVLTIKYLFKDGQLLQNADPLADWVDEYTGWAGRQASVVVQPLASDINSELFSSWYARNSQKLELVLRNDKVSCIIRERWGVMPRVLPQLHKM